MASFLLSSQTTNGDRACNGAEGVSGRQADGAKMRHRGFPRIIKAGHGIKQGAVVGTYLEIAPEGLAGISPCHEAMGFISTREIFPIPDCFVRHYDSIILFFGIN